jgi:hypothetical protein
LLPGYSNSRPKAAAGFATQAAGERAFGYTREVLFLVRFALLIAAGSSTVGCVAVPDAPITADAAIDDTDAAPQIAELDSCADVPVVPILPETGETTAYVDGQMGSDDPTLCVSPETPCKSIQFTLSTYATGKNGDVILVRGNHQYEEQTITLSVLRAWPGTGRPTLHAAGADYAIRSCCGGSSASDFVIAGFEISGGSVAGIALDGNSATRITIYDNLVFDNGQGAGSTGQVFDAGILLLNGSSNNSIVANEIFGNVDSTSNTVSGIRTNANGGTINNVVAFNDVHDNERGIVFKSNSNLIYGNRVYANVKEGIELTTTLSMRLCHNRTFGNGEHDVLIDRSDGTEILHHTMASYGDDGLELASSTLTTIKNSIFAFGTDCGITVAGGEDAADANNLYFAVGGGNQCGAEAQQDDPATDVEGMDPLFRDRIGGDLDLFPESPARGAGENGTDIGSLRR